jgi:prefoldin subunit 5
MKGIWKPQGKIINKETKKRRQSAWYTSLVDLYLNNNRKLLGELQLYRYTKVNGKRKNIPEGDPIQKYYGEAVIDLDLFNSVQEIIRTNAKKDGRGGGRGDLVNNLFNHMAVCSGCGSPMRYMNKGNELRTADQFKCANALIGLCNFPKLHYLEVEKEVLTFCKGLEVADIIPNKENTLSELSLLQNQLQAKEGEIESIEKKMENMKADTEKPMSYEFKKALGESYELKKIELDKLIAERDEIQNQIALLSVNGKQTEEHIKSIRELIDLMDNMRKDESKKQELLNLRLNLRSQLRRLIKKISVSSGGLMIYFQSGQMRRIMFNEKPSQFKVWDRNRPPKSMLK